MTALGAALVFASPLAALAAAPADNTWAPLGPLPESLDSPIFALAVNPVDARGLVAGTANGSIYRSSDGGATWTSARQGLGRGVLSLAFNPYRAGQVMAGVRGGGAWKSADGGSTWTAAGSLGTASPRSFGFAKTLIAAGTDRGVFTSRDGSTWSAAGLTQLSVSALAVPGIADPARLVAGADSDQAADGLPMFQSPDGGASWAALPGPASASNMVAAIAAGPLADKMVARPLLMGTTNGLFSSLDNGAKWVQLTGGGVLPASDFSAVAYSNRADRFYVASDGGGFEARGGLWASADSGQHFTGLQPPSPSITALAVSGDDQPMVYVAGFRPSDHSVSLWAYRDAGGAPLAPAAKPAAPVKPVVAPVAAVPRRDTGSWLGLLMTGPEGPYLAVGLGSVLVLMLALIAYARRSRV